jgi:hypothetical protein
MLELPVAAARCDEVPPIFIEQSKDFTHLHVPTLALAPIPTTSKCAVIR